MPKPQEKLKEALMRGLLLNMAEQTPNDFTLYGLPSEVISNQLSAMILLGVDVHMQGDVVEERLLLQQLIDIVSAYPRSGYTDGLHLIVKDAQPLYRCLEAARKKL